MKKNYLVTLGIFVGVIVIIATIVGFKSFINNEPVNNEDHMGVGADSPEEFYGWKENLDILIFEKFLEVFPEDYDFKLKDNEKFEITLRELKDQYNVDLSEFNTDTIKCNLDTSKIKVVNEYGEVLRMADLRCANANEQ